MEGESWSPLSGSLVLSLGMLFLTGIVAWLTLLLNRKIKKNHPEFLLLNCWFCNEDFPIPYQKANSWTCPGCEGYNGFSEDGDYNTDLQTASLRHRRFAKPASSPSPNLSYLCRNCELNQCLKINQLAAFVPQDERNFDAEVEAYEAHLDRVYRLCRRCEATLHQKLGEQDSKLRSNLLSWRIESNRLAAKREGGLSAFVHVSPRASLRKRMLVSLLALCLAASYEAVLITGMLTILLLLAYNSGGLLQLRCHRMAVFLWVTSFSLGILKEYASVYQDKMRMARILMGLLCCAFTIFVWNMRPPSKKKAQAGLKKSSLGFRKSNFSGSDDWGLLTSTPAPSVVSSRASSVFSPKEEEGPSEEPSKYDISSLSIEDNVETEFTLMGNASDKPSGNSGKGGSPPFIIKKYNGVPGNEVSFSKEKKETRRLLRPATLSPPPESPSKGVAKASWVAGGYWHTKDKLNLSSHERTLSRSSSQSSGFISYDNDPGAPSLRVIRNTFARSSLPPEPIVHEPLLPRRRLLPSSSDRFSCDEPSFQCSNAFRDSSSSIASSSRQDWNNESINNKSHNVSIMDKEFNVRFSCYSLILGLSVLSNLLLMGFLVYNQFIIHSTYVSSFA